MVGRRDLLVGAACLAAAGAAFSLKPRKRLVLLKGKMADAIPMTFGGWTAQSADGLVQPKTEGELAATLYSEMVGRIYYEEATGIGIMMLAAYGDTQSDLLQLHRPESCYPAVGFNLLSTKEARLALPTGGAVPVREVVASAPGRQESIIYWTRMGEYLPASSGEQRKVRLQTAMEGYIPDGVLIRFSMVGADAPAAFKKMEDFIKAMLAAVASDKRAALIGSTLAKAMAA